MALDLDALVQRLHTISPTGPTEAVGPSERPDNTRADFDWTKSLVREGLIRHFGVIPSRPDLLTLAQYLQEDLRANLTPPTRSEARRTVPLLNWYGRNWALIDPLLTCVDLTALTASKTS
jgi:hypothetical protein